MAEGLRCSAKAKNFVVSCVYEHSIPSVSGPKLLPPLFPLDPLHYKESSSSKLQYRRDKSIYRPMGRVTSNKMHYLTVNYLTRSVPRHFHSSFVKLGVISCHDPVTKYIYDCYQLNLTIENLNFHMSSNSPASIVCWNFFQIESCKHLKVFYNCCLHGILLGLFSFPLQDHIVSAVHRMVDQKEVLHFSTQKYRKEGIYAKTRDDYSLLVGQ